MEFYNDKTKTLTLVIDVKNDELLTETYNYPIFVKGYFTKKAIVLGAVLEGNKFMVDESLYDDLSKFIVGLYGDQFTIDELVDGIDARNNVPTFVAILFGVLNGDSEKNE